MPHRGWCLRGNMSAWVQQESWRQPKRGKSYDHDDLLVNIKQQGMDRTNVLVLKA